MGWTVGSASPLGNWKTRSGRQCWAPGWRRGAETLPRSPQRVVRHLRCAAAWRHRRGGDAAWGAPVGAGGGLAEGCWCPRWKGWSFRSRTPFPAMHQDTLGNTGVTSSTVYPVCPPLSLGSPEHPPAWMSPAESLPAPSWPQDLFQGQGWYLCFWPKVVSTYKPVAARANSSPAADP